MLVARIKFILQLCGHGQCLVEEKYNRIFNDIHNAAKTLSGYWCEKAVDEEKKANEKRENLS